MRIQGSLPTHLPTAAKRRKPGSDPVDTPAETTPLPVVSSHFRQPDPDIDYIAANEYLDLDQRELSATARRALRGYWLTQQQNWHSKYIDIYV